MGRLAPSIHRESTDSLMRVTYLGQKKEKMRRRKEEEGQKGG